jgi:hypothetical protein
LETSLNAETFAEWLRRQGHRVERTESSFWYEAHARVYQAFPFHSIVRPDEVEITGLLRRRSAIALRYSTPLDAPAGCVSYHIVCDDRGYGLEKLNRHTRKNVATGLERCRVERLPVSRLAEEGWALELDSARRQSRETPLSERSWCARYRAAAELPGFEAWGALVDGRLAASLLAFQMGDCCELISQQCLSEFLDARVNHAMSFVATQTIIRRPGIRSIFYTLQSLDAPPKVDEFKLRMGYRVEPVRQRVAFHPWARPALRPFTNKVLRSCLRRRPSSRFLAKAEGMLRFHLQGRRPLSEQTWPELVRPTSQPGTAATARPDPGGERASSRPGD